VVNKILDLIITFVVWAAFISIPIHELGHHLATVLQGGTATIQYQGFWAGFTYTEGLSPGEYQIMAFSGGLFAALIMGLLWWRARTSPTWWDTDDLVVLACLGGMQMLYGLVEGATLGVWGYRGIVPQSFVILAPVAMAAGFLIPLFLYLPKIADWLKGGENDIEKGIESDL